MKYSIDFTNRFKKSLRKGVKRGLDPSLIEKAVDELAREGKLPASYKPHKLLPLLRPCCTSCRVPARGCCLTSSCNSMAHDGTRGDIPQDRSGWRNHLCAAV